MRSNCVAVAWRAFWFAWNADEPRGEETYFCIRKTRSKNGIVHTLIGRYDRSLHAIKVQSFKPLRPVDVPWYLAWKRLRFDGHMVDGDTFHPTQPPRG